MPDITAVMTALNGIKTAIGIAKSLKDLDSSLEKAELKLQMADLMNALADAKISISETQDLINEKDKEIFKLKEAFKIKGKMVRHIHVYYLTDEKGKKIGDPFCSYCYEDKQKAIHVVQDPSKRRNFVCPECKTETDWHTLD